MMVLLLVNQQHNFKQLNRWFLSEPGLKIASVFTKELVRVYPLLKGESVLQLGNCGKNPWFNQLPFKYRWILAPFETNQAQIISSITQIPIDRNSLNCVLSPLALDAFPASKKPLDEIDRVVKAMGHVIFFGINPISLWGCWLRYSKESCYGDFHPWSRSLITIKQAMVHRGYSQVYLSCFYYIPPFKQARWINRFELLNEIGKMISPLPSAFYCLVMQKYQPSPVRPVPVSLREAVAV